MTINPVANMFSYTHRMVLGTAQLGLKYGIANRRGKPDKQEAMRILQTALREGIRYIDTAPGYKSESIIGDFVRAEGIQREINVLTKIPSLGGREEWKDFVHRSITASFRNLGIDKLEALFFHNPKDALLLYTDAAFFDELMSLFPIGSLGVSVYDPDEVDIMGNCGYDLAFQFPFNLLDIRFENNSIPKGKRYGRSIFLQGLLAARSLSPDVPIPLKELHSVIWEDCETRNLSALQLAFAFALGADCIDYLLIGVDSPEQLRDLLCLIK